MEQNKKESKEQIDFDFAIKKVREVQNQCFFCDEAKQNDYQYGRFSKPFGKQQMMMEQFFNSMSIKRKLKCGKEEAKFYSLLLPRKKVFCMDKIVVLENGKTSVRQDAFLICDKLNATSIDDSVELLQLTGKDAGRFFDNKSVKFSYRPFEDGYVGEISAGDYKNYLHSDFYLGHKICFEHNGKSLNFNDLSPINIIRDMSIFEIESVNNENRMNKSLKQKDAQEVKIFEHINETAKPSSTALELENLDNQSL